MPNNQVYAEVPIPSYSSIFELEDIREEFESALWQWDCTVEVRVGDSHHLFEINIWSVVYSTDRLIEMFTDATYWYDADRCLQLDYVTAS